MKQVIELFQQLVGRVDSVGFVENRTSVNTSSIFGHMMKFSMVDGYPLITTRKIYLHGVFEELKWIIKGDTNVNSLQKVGVNFWNQWANEDGELGPVYGEMWRRWPAVPGGYIDQLQKLINDLKHNPKSRRHIITAWNPAFLPDETKSFSENIADGKQALPPCHCFFQFSARKLTSIDFAKFKKLRQTRLAALEVELQLMEERLIKAAGDVTDVNQLTEIVLNYSTRITKVKKLLDEISTVEADDVGVSKRVMRQPALEEMPEYGLSLLLYMRSNDTPIGLPTNIAGYAALLHLVAKECGMMPEEYIHVTGDTHLYENQLDGVSEQIKRKPYNLPILDVEFNYQHDPKNTHPDDYFYNHLDEIQFEVYGYRYHPAIKYPLAAL